jgi:ABC-2 type transport system ATP-binding protein
LAQSFTLSRAGEKNNIKGSAIEVQDLSKSFGSQPALSGVTFSVLRGAVHGFLGPNGAGKTTAIKIILGLSAADSGQVKVLGEPLSFGRRHNFLQHLNYLPQDPVFPEGLTGREALTLVAGMYRINRHKSRLRIEKLLEYFELQSAANRRVGVYSRGMQQRLGLAAVLLTEPELLILDEPVSALDPDGRRRVLDLINRLKGRATIFFSSHILADVERICDHITIIDRGRKLLDAETSDLLTRYAMEQYIITVRPEDHLRATRLISHNRYVRQVSSHLNQLYVVSKPGQSLEMAEELLPELIKQGIVVREFVPNRTNLEDAFFRVIEEHHLAEQIK